MKMVMSALAIALAAPAAANTLPPLGQDAFLIGQLVEGRAADVIRKTCPLIGARKIAAWNEIKRLERYALDKGYSDREIKAFIDSKAERNKIKDLAKRWLRDRGAREGDVEAHCALGRQLIATGTPGGRLLYLKG